MPIQLDKRVSLSSQGARNPKLARSASVAVPSPVLRSLSHLPGNALKSAHSVSKNAAGLVDITFRLYTNEDGHLRPVDLSESTLAKSLSQVHSDNWDAILNPSTLPHERDAELSSLLGVPLEGQASVGLQKKLQRYASVLLMSASSDGELIPAVKAAEPQYSSRTEGEPGTLAFRTFVQEQGADISPWHDIAVHNEDGTLNFVCEIPKDTTAKFEVATAESSNPIKQDVKKGVLRNYPYSIPWNYGMLPQTWEDPNAAHAALPGIVGDDDPVDVVEIGGTPLETAGVYCVKALGAYAMIDSGELDWKVICIRADHPLASKLNDITDVEREMPGELEKIMVWFRDYKIPDGKPANAFGFDNKPVDKDYAHDIVDETHEAYKQLRIGARKSDADLVLR